MLAWLSGALWLIAGMGVAGPRAAAGVEDLVPSGDWYVLVHYRVVGAEDPVAAEPARGAPQGATGAGEEPGPVQWDDEVWRIERTAGRVVWTVHPHVALRDRRGRFEVLASGDEARSTGAWSPSAEQLAEIRRGLVLDHHEARTKTLRGSDAAGYRSTGAPRAASASAIAYGETWSIGGTPGRAVLVRQGTLTSGRAEPAEGATRFEIREGPIEGGEWRGVYSRDDRLLGTFRMIPTAGASGERP